MTIFHLPILSRYDIGLIRSPGPGLGNLLFPISRAIAGNEKYKGVIVRPTIRQIKFGSILRREPDTRMYHDVFRHRNPQQWKHWICAKSATQRVAESDIDSSSLPGVVTYEGLGRYFHDISHAHTPIVNWLKEHGNIDVPDNASYDVGVHIRQGDFLATTNEDTANTGIMSVRNSFDWYRNAISKAIDISGKQNPRLLVLTDGDQQVISKELSSFPNIVFDNSKNALSAIFHLSTANTIVTSRSSFSMWGVFIGNRTAIWNRNFELSDYMPVRKDHDIFV